MTAMTWSETYSVGSAMLDADHRILFSLLEQLDDVLETGQSRDVVGSVVNVLTEYVEHHFQREETVMQAVGYPLMDDHVQAHRRFAADVRAIRDAWMSGRRQALNGDVSALLTEWLRDHILKTDQAYRPWVEDADGRADHITVGTATIAGEAGRAGRV